MSWTDSLSTNSYLCPPNRRLMNPPNNCQLAPQSQHTLTLLGTFSGKPPSLDSLYNQYFLPSRDFLLPLIGLSSTLLVESSTDHKVLRGAPTAHPVSLCSKSHAQTTRSINCTPQPLAASPAQIDYHWLSAPLVDHSETPKMEIWLILIYHDQAYRYARFYHSDQPHTFRLLTMYIPPTIGVSLKHSAKIHGAPLQYWTDYYGYLCYTVVARDILALDRHSMTVSTSCPIPSALLNIIPLLFSAYSHTVQSPGNKPNTVSILLLCDSLHFTISFAVLYLIVNCGFLPILSLTKLADSIPSGIHTKLATFILMHMHNWPRTVVIRTCHSL